MHFDNIKTPAQLIAFCDALDYVGDPEAFRPLANAMGVRFGHGRDYVQQRAYLLRRRQELARSEAFELKHPGTYASEIEKDREHIARSERHATWLSEHLIYCPEYVAPQVALAEDALPLHKTRRG